jgi:hypothetical protein
MSVRQFISSNGPGLALGLFLGRLISETLAFFGPFPVNIWMGAAITAVSLPFGLLLTRRCPVGKRWPFWLLLGYVLYPYPDWRAALAVTAVTLIVVLLQARAQWGWLEARWLPTPLFLAAGVGFLALYLLTLAPGLLPADNGEYQLVAAALGVAHPPGFPLYTLLGHLMTRLPLGPTPAYRLNQFSAVPSTLTLLLVMATVWQLTRSRLASVTAVLALGSATTFWAQATTANIRSLTALFAALALFALIRFRHATQAGNGRAADRYLILLGLAMGAGLAHHLSLAFMALIFLLFLLFADPALLKTPRRWLKPALAGLLGFLPLLYLPLRANSGAPGATPELATLPGFLSHALGLGFSGDFFYYTAPAQFWERLRVMGNVMSFQFAPWLLAGMAAGLLLMLWRDRLLALLLGGAFAIHLAITATYRAPQTVEYMLPAYVPAVISLGYAAGFLVSFSFRRRWLTAVAHTIAAIILVTAVRQTITHYPSYRDLSQPATRAAVQPLLENAPTDSILLADWHWATPLWYLQEVENLRPDVTVEFVYPRTADYGEDWATRIREELANGRAVISTHYDENAYAPLPPAQPYGDAYLFPQEPLTTLPANFTPLDLTLGDAIHIRGYQLADTAVSPTESTTLTLAWQPAHSSLITHHSSLSLFTHLTSSDGRLYAQQDLPAIPQPDGITLTRFRLTPRPGAQPGEYTLLIGAYGDQPLLAENGEPRTAVAPLTIQPMPRPLATQNPLYRPAANGRTLIGYDWDNTLNPQTRLYLHWQTPGGYETGIRDNLLPKEVTLPPTLGPWGVVQGNWALSGEWVNSQYVPLEEGVIWTGDLLPGTDSPVALPQHFAASRPILSDLVVSVRLIGYEEDGYHWAWTDLDDSIPALGAIPTLKWIAGSRVRSPHTLAVSEQAASGQTIGATLRLYDAFTNRPLPILDERITAVYPWIPLGQRPLPQEDNTSR